MLNKYGLNEYMNPDEKNIYTDSHIIYTYFLGGEGGSF